MPAGTPAWRAEARSTKARRLEMQTIGSLQAPRTATGVDRDLEVNVIYTNPSATLVALREAARLAANLGARIRIVLPSVVPYPLPLQEPPVAEEHQRRRLRAVAGEATVETSAEIFYCRDVEDVARALAPESLVVIGGKKRWWPWRASGGIQRAMVRSGHRVILV